MDVHESALLPGLVSDSGLRVVGSEQHPWHRQPAEEPVDGALPLHSPASPSFAMQKLRTRKEGTGILLGMASALPRSVAACKAAAGLGRWVLGPHGEQGGAGTEEEQASGGGPLYICSANKQLR